MNYEMKGLKSPVVHIGDRRHINHDVDLKTMKCGAVIPSKMAVPSLNPAKVSCQYCKAKGN